MLTKAEIQQQLDQSLASRRDLLEALHKTDGMIQLCNHWLAKIANEEAVAANPPSVEPETVKAG